MLQGHHGSAVPKFFRSFQRASIASDADVIVTCEVAVQCDVGVGAMDAEVQWESHGESSETQKVNFATQCDFDCHEDYNLAGGQMALLTGLVGKKHSATAAQCTCMDGHACATHRPHHNHHNHHNHLRSHFGSSHPRRGWLEFRSHGGSSPIVTLFPDALAPGHFCHLHSVYISRFASVCCAPCLLWNRFWWRIFVCAFPKLRSCKFDLALL